MFHTYTTGTEGPFVAQPVDIKVVRKETFAFDR